jgi:VanZ family protein
LFSSLRAFVINWFFCSRYACFCGDMPEPAQSKLRNFLIYWLPVIAYCLAIFVQSSQPGLKPVPDVRFIDKILHFGAYGLLGILFYRAYETLPLRDNIKLLMFISITSSTLYGVSDEIHQYFVPLREAEILDAAANLIGSVCGVLLYHLWHHRRPA